MDHTRHQENSSEVRRGSTVSKPLEEWAAFLTLGCVAWGTSFLWIKIGLQEVGPFMLVAMRLTFGTLGIWVILILFKVPMPRSRTEISAGALLGLCNTAIPFTLIAWGETKITSGLTGILNATTPLLTIVIAHLFLSDQRIMPSKLLGLMFGFAGIVLLFSHDIVLYGLSGNIWAQIAIICASISYAVSAVYTRRVLGGQHPITLAAISLTGAMVMMWVLTSLIDGALTWPKSPIVWVAATWLGLIGTALAYPLLFYLIRTWGPTRTMTVTYLIPIVAVTLGIVFLAETLNLYLILGGMLVITGVAITNSRQQ